MCLTYKTQNTITIYTFETLIIVKSNSFYYICIVENKTKRKNDFQQFANITNSMTCRAQVTHTLNVWGWKTSSSQGHTSNQK